MKHFFEFEKYNTNYRQEIIAGLTTFATMSYIIVVNPAILEVAGIPKGPSMVATILSAVFGTLVMAFYAKRPFAIAPYMGANTFIAFTVVKILGYSWQTALAAVFVGGVIFTLLTLFNVRSWLSKSFPMSLKNAFAVGIGMFIVLIGLVGSGLVGVGTAEAPLQLGNFRDPKVILLLIGFVVVVFLEIKKIPGSILITILFISGLSIATGVSPAPEQIISMPPSIEPIFMKIDFVGAFSWGFISVIIAIFVMDFVDTMGTLIGLSIRANLLDENGELPEIKKPMLADALATVAGSILGTSTSGAYIESAAGIEAGGKTGFTAAVVAFLFLLSLFFSPLLTSIPQHAYAPALLLVGVYMIEPVRRIDFDDYTEYVPAMITILLMCLTYNIGIGITTGFIFYVILKTITGRWREVHPGMWILSAISAIYYIFHP